jgi:predicted amino acid dehydrogenase
VERFAFIIHPMDKSDVARKYKIASFLPESAVEWIVKRMEPKYVSHVTGVRSKTGAELEGWFVGCPLTARQMLALDEGYVLDKITATAKLAQELGAGIVGLGAFTSVVGDAGLTVKAGVDIAVTSGNSYTVATAVEGLFKAGALMNAPADSVGAVVGAGGSIGKVCARLMARRLPKLILIDKNPDAVTDVVSDLKQQGKCEVEVATEVSTALPQADLVIAVSSAAKAIVQAKDLKRGSVVCDVARPRDVSRRVVEERNDVLVIEGGMIAVPGEPDFGFNFGFPPGTAYACMSETMICALEGTYESYTLGRDLAIEQVERIARLAEKHGFELAGFRSFERRVEEDYIESVRRNAGRA